MTFIPWSPDEDERLRKLALSGASMAEIAQQMQRTKSSIRTRASKLKIAIAREENPMQKVKACGT
jgi:DNA-directed RNA polymerase specialized sigma24 family protein